MTFDEWWFTLNIDEFTMGEKILAETAWQAATLEEREICALLCEALWDINGTYTARQFANTIRARSNAELTGAKPRRRT